MPGHHESRRPVRRARARQAAPEPAGYDLDPRARQLYRDDRRHPSAWPGRLFKLAILAGLVWMASRLPGWWAGKEPERPFFVLETDRHSVSNSPQSAKATLHVYLPNAVRYDFETMLKNLYKPDEETSFETVSVKANNERIAVNSGDALATVTAQDGQLNLSVPTESGTLDVFMEWSKPSRTTIRPFPLGFHTLVTLSGEEVVRRADAGPERPKLATMLNELMKPFEVE